MGRTMRLERRAHVPLALAAAAPVAAVAAALALAAGLIGAAGVNPLAAYGEMLRGALGLTAGADRDADPRRAADVDGPRRRRRLPRAAVEYRGRGPVLSRCAGGGLGRPRDDLGPAARGRDRGPDGRGHGGGGAPAGGACLSAAAVRGRRGGHDAPPELRGDPFRWPDDRGAVARSARLRLAAIGAGRQCVPPAGPGAADAPARGASDRARRGGYCLADPRAHRLRDGGAGRGLQRARRGLRGRVAAADDHGRGAPVGRAGGAWRARSRSWASRAT
jgi:hypothetical protein